MQGLTVSGHRRHVIYPTVGTVLLVLGGLLCAGGQQAVRAQASASSPDPRAGQWRLVLDGERVAWPDTVATASPSRVRATGRRVLRHLRRKGHYYATIDSVSVDTSSAGPDVRFYARRGPQVRVGTLRLRGDSAVPATELRALMETEEGAPLRPDRLEADVQRLLDRYEEAGHPLAQIRVAETMAPAAERAALRVTLQIDEGPALWLRRVEAPDDARATPELLAYLAGLEENRSLRGYDPDAIQRRLQAHDLFETVGPPQLRVADDGGAVLQIPIEEAPPGAFDAVLGYLPPSATRNSGQLVGSGHLVLQHLFGGG